MRVNNIRIRNFRTVRAEVSFEAKSGLVVVGPNNAGKSNLLRAIKVFFSGSANSEYKHTTDLAHGANRERTSISVTFNADTEKDGEFVRLHEELRLLHPDPPPATGSITLNVYFTEGNKSVYSFFPNIKRPKGAPNAAYSRVQGDLLEKIFNTFKVIYIPSDKSYSEVFSEIVSPEIVRHTADITRKIIPEVNGSLREISSIMNDTLGRCGMSEIRTSILTGDSAHHDFMSSVNLNIADQITTEFSRKGTGVQSAAIFSALVWIDQMQRESGIQPIWLIEEPESYLHPQLSGVVNRLLSELSRQSTVIVTTHSLAFVPTDVERVVGCEVESGRTVLRSFDNYAEATDRIRRSLGVRFSDYFNLDVNNIAVEGKSDRSLFEEVMRLVDQFDPAVLDQWAHLRNAKFLTFTGVKDLAAFVKTTYHMISQERVLVSIFDGDEGGVRARAELQGFFGNKRVPFNNGTDFLSVRHGFAIEALFPDEWIVDIHRINSEYFRTFSTDVFGDLEPFSIRDEHKSKIQNLLLDRAEAATNPEWASKFILMFEAMDTAISNQTKRLAKAA